MKSKRDDALKLGYEVFVVVGLLLVVGGFVCLFSLTLKEDKPEPVPLLETERFAFPDDIERERKRQSLERYRERVRESEEGREENEQAWREWMHMIESIEQARAMGY